MIANTKINRSMHPQKFAMWLFIVSVVMVFISLSSAYVVKKSFGEWVYVDFPDIFIFNTVLIILSSISMHWAFVSTKKDRISQIKISLISTAILAWGFVIGQYFAWGDLVDGGFYLVGNPASSFVYIFTGLHIAHLLGAIILLLVVLIKTFLYKVHSKKMLLIGNCTIFWHFLSGLWIYLYLFLTLNN